MTTVRLYGLTKGHGSYAQVLSGIERAFRVHGYGEGRLAVVDVAERAEEPALPTADVGIFLGPPVACSELAHHASHRIRCVMVAPNSDRLPEPTMSVVNAHATHVLVPSEWAAGVAGKYTPHPVLVVPHGVHPEFQLSRAPDLERQYEAGEFRVLHLSSSSRERKGTLLLVAAWRRLRKQRALPTESRLWLIVGADMRAQILDWLSDEGEALDALGILLGWRLGIGQEGAAPAELTKIYAGVHVVCQPSRGEAFGLCCPEALASGVPIVATSCTGHAQWFTKNLPGAVPIEHGRQIEIDDLPGARAPLLTVYAVAEALERAHEDWHALKTSALTNAENMRLVWSWERQTESLIRFLEGEAT